MTPLLVLVILIRVVYCVVLFRIRLVRETFAVLLLFVILVGLVYCVALFRIGLVG